MGKPMVSLIARTGDRMMFMEVDPAAGQVASRSSVPYSLLEELAGRDSASMAGESFPPFIAYLGRRSGRWLFTVTTLSRNADQYSLRSHLALLDADSLEVISSYSLDSGTGYTAALSVAGRDRAFVICNTSSEDNALIITLDFSGSSHAGSVDYRISSAMAVTADSGETLLVVETADVMMV